jgi:anti-sigma regulatory factor (Ser/Thr protein kinase)
MSTDDATAELSTDEILDSCRPPTSFELVQSWVLGSTEQLASLRVAILREMAAEACDPAVVLTDVADDMVLIATELATNAIVHGLPPTEVRLLHTDHVYLLDITDHDPVTPPVVAGPRAPGHGGFGLRMAQRLAIDVGWYADDGVKHVWAIMNAPRT